MDFSSIGQFHENRHEILKKLSNITDTIILSFSCSKDSIAMWLECKKYFKNIVPYFYYLVPELSFVDKEIRYYENYFETKIYSFPHPNTIKMLCNGVYNHPDSREYLMNDCILLTYQYDYMLMQQIIRESLKLHDDIPVAIGIRASDTLWRRLNIKKHGCYRPTKKVFYPIFDMNQKELIELIRTNNLKLPPDYFMFHRSLNSISWLHSNAIKKYYPDDFEKLKAFFPLIEADIKRGEFRKKYLKGV